MDYTPEPRANERYLRLTGWWWWRRVELNEMQMTVRVCLSGRRESETSRTQTLFGDVYPALSLIWFLKGPHHGSLNESLSETHSRLSARRRL